MDHAHQGPGDEGLGELRDEFSEGFEDEELEESLDHGLASNKFTLWC
jgi:hypothetical protein